MASARTRAQRWKQQLEVRTTLTCQYRKVAGPKPGKSAIAAFFRTHLGIGNAQAGFVALAHALSPVVTDKGKFWIILADDYSPLEQGVVILTKSQEKREANQFLEFVRTKEVAEILRKYGFTLPQN